MGFKINEIRAGVRTCEPAVLSQVSYGRVVTNFLIFQKLGTWKQCMTIFQIGGVGFLAGGEENWNGKAQPHKCHSEKGLEPECCEIVYANGGLLKGVMGWHLKSEKSRLNT